MEKIRALENLNSGLQHNHVSDNTTMDDLRKSQLTWEEKIRALESLNNQSQSKHARVQERLRVLDLVHVGSSMKTPFPLNSIQDSLDQVCKM